MKQFVMLFTTWVSVDSDLTADKGFALSTTVTVVGLIIPGPVQAQYPTLDRFIDTGSASRIHFLELLAVN